MVINYSKQTFRAKGTRVKVRARRDEARRALSNKMNLAQYDRWEKNNFRIVLQGTKKKGKRKQRETSDRKYRYYK